MGQEGRHYIIFPKKQANVDLDEKFESGPLARAIAGSKHNRLLAFADGKGPVTKKIVQATNYVLLIEQMPFLVMGALLIMGVSEVLAKLVESSNPDGDPVSILQEQVQWGQTFTGIAFILAAIIQLIAHKKVVREPDFNRFKDGEVLENKLPQNLVQPSSNKATQLQAGYALKNLANYLIAEGAPDAAAGLLYHAIKSFSSSPIKEEMDVVVLEPAANTHDSSAAVVAPAELNDAVPNDEAAPAADSLLQREDRVASPLYSAAQPQGVAANVRAFRVRHGVETLRADADPGWNARLIKALGKQDGCRAVPVIPEMAERDVANFLRRPRASTPSVASIASTVEDSELDDVGVLAPVTREVHEKIPLSDPRFLPVMTGDDKEKAFFRIKRCSDYGEAGRAVDIVSFDKLTPDEIRHILGGEVIASPELDFMGELPMHPESVPDAIAGVLSDAIGYKDEVEKARAIRGLSRVDIRKSWLITFSKPFECKGHDKRHPCLPLLLADEKRRTLALVLMKIVARRPEKGRPIQWHDARSLLRPVSDTIKAFDELTAEQQVNVFAALIYGTESCQLVALPPVFSGLDKRAQKTFKQMATALTERMTTPVNDAAQHQSTHYDNTHQLIHLTRWSLTTVQQVLVKNSGLMAQVLRSLLCTITEEDKLENQSLLKKSFKKKAPFAGLSSDIACPSEEQYEVAHQAAQRMLGGCSFQSDQAIRRDLRSSRDDKKLAKERIEARTFLYARQRQEIERAARAHATNIFWASSVHAQKEAITPLATYHKTVWGRLFDTREPHNFNSMLQQGGGLFQENESILSMLLEGEVGNWYGVALRIMLKIPEGDGRLVHYLKTNVSSLFPLKSGFSDKRLKPLGCYYQIESALEVLQFDNEIEKEDARRRLCVQWLQALDQHPEMRSHEFRGRYIYSIYRNFYLPKNNAANKPSVFEFFQDLAKDSNFNSDLRQESLYHCFNYLIKQHNKSKVRGRGSVHQIYGEDSSVDYFDGLLPDLLLYNDGGQSWKCSIAADIIQSLVRAGFDGGKIEEKVMHHLRHDPPGVPGDRKKDARKFLLVATITGLQRATIDKKQQVIIYLRRLYCLLHSNCGVESYASATDLVIGVNDSQLLEWMWEFEVAYISMHNDGGHDFALLGHALTETDGLYLSECGNELLYNSQAVLINLLPAAAGFSGVVRSVLLRLSRCLQKWLRGHAQDGKKTIIEKLAGRLFANGLDDLLKHKIVAAITDALLSCGLDEEQLGDLLQYLHKEYYPGKSAFAFLEAIFIGFRDALQYNGNSLSEKMQLLRTSYLNFVCAYKRNLYSYASPNNRFSGSKALRTFFMGFCLEDGLEQDGLVGQSKIGRQKKILRIMLRYPGQRYLLIVELGQIMTNDSLDSPANAGAPHKQKQYSIFTMIQLLLELDYPEQYRDVYWLLDQLGRAVDQSLPDGARVPYLIEHEDTHKPIMTALGYTPAQNLKTFVSNIYSNQSEIRWSLGEYVATYHEADLLPFMVQRLDPGDNESIKAFALEITDNCIQSRAITDINLKKIGVIKDMDESVITHELKVKLIAALVYHFDQKSHDLNTLYAIHELLNTYRLYRSNDVRYSLETELNAIFRQLGCQERFDVCDGLIEEEASERDVTCHYLLPKLTLSSLNLLALQSDSPDKKVLEEICWHRLVDCLGNDKSVLEGNYQPMLLCDRDARLQLKAMIILLAKIGCYNTDDDDAGVKKWSRLVARALYRYFDNAVFDGRELDVELADALVTLALEVSQQDASSDGQTMTPPTGLTIHEQMREGITKIYGFMDIVLDRGKKLAEKPTYQDEVLGTHEDEEVIKRLKDAKLRLGLVFSKGLVQHYDARMNEYNQSARFGGMWHRGSLPKPLPRDGEITAQTALKKQYGLTMYHTLSKESGGYSGLKTKGIVYSSLKMGRGKLHEFDAEMNLYAVDGNGGIYKLFDENMCPFSASSGGFGGDSSDDGSTDDGSTEDDSTSYDESTGDDEAGDYVAIEMQPPEDLLNAGSGDSDDETQPLLPAERPQQGGRRFGVFGVT